MKTLCIINAGREKIWDRDPKAGQTMAKDVYVGPFYRKCRAYAELFYEGSWMLLSPKHGFLEPEELLHENYDVTFRLKRTNPIQVENLTLQAKERGMDGYDRVVIVGGKRYIAIVREVFGDRVVAPLEGVPGNGLMMSLLKRAVEERRELQAFKR